MILAVATETNPVPSYVFSTLTAKLKNKNIMSSPDSLKNSSLAFEKHSHALNSGIYAWIISGCYIAYLII